jgi:hypothetical protein
MAHLAHFLNGSDCWLVGSFDPLLALVRSVVGYPPLFPGHWYSVCQVLGELSSPKRSALSPMPLILYTTPELRL